MIAKDRPYREIEEDTGISRWSLIRLKKSKSDIIEHIRQKIAEQAVKNITRADMYLTDEKLERTRALDLSKIREMELSIALRSLGQPTEIHEHNFRVDQMDTETVKKILSGQAKIIDGEVVEVDQEPEVKELPESIEKKLEEINFND